MTTRSRERRQQRQRKQRSRWPEARRENAPIGRNPIEAQEQEIIEAASQAAKHAGNETLTRGSSHEG